MNDSLGIDVDGRFGLVGLDASDVERFFGGQDFHQFIHGVFENGASGQRSFGGFGNVMTAFRPHALIDGI